MLYVKEWTKRMLQVLTSTLLTLSKLSIMKLYYALYDWNKHVRQLKRAQL